MKMQLSQTFSAASSTSIYSTDLARSPALSILKVAIESHVIVTSASVMLFSGQKVIIIIHYKLSL